MWSELGMELGGARVGLCFGFRAERSGDTAADRVGPDGVVEGSGHGRRDALQVAAFEADDGTCGEAGSMCFGDGVEPDGVPHSLEGGAKAAADIGRKGGEVVVGVVAERFILLVFEGLGSNEYAVGDARRGVDAGEDEIWLYFIQNDKKSPKLRF